MKMCVWEHEFFTEACVPINVHIFTQYGPATSIKNRFLIVKIINWRATFLAIANTHALGISDAGAYIRFEMFSFPVYLCIVRVTVRDFNFEYPVVFSCPSFIVVSVTSPGSSRKTVLNFLSRFRWSKTSIGCCI